MFHVKFRSKTGVYLGLHFVDGVSREIVEGPHDPMLRRLRAVWGSGSYSLIPVEQKASAPATPTRPADSALKPDPAKATTAAKPKADPAKPVKGHG